MKRRAGGRKKFEKSFHPTLYKYNNINILLLCIYVSITTTKLYYCTNGTRYLISRMLIATCADDGAGNERNTLTLTV